MVLFFRRERSWLGGPETSGRETRAFRGSLKTFFIYQW